MILKKIKKKLNSNMKYLGSQILLEVWYLKKYYT